MLQLCYFFVKIERHKGKPAVSDCRDIMQKIYKGLAVLLLCAALFTEGCQKKTAVFSSNATEELHQTEETNQDVKAIQETQEQTYGYVYVCGAVNEPGVYPISADMRVFEAVELAGGFSDNADVSWTNQAEAVQDGQKLYIYTEEETSLMTADTGSEEQDSGMTADGKVNINQATKDILLTLPGIGEAKADAVIQYRETYGAFASIEEIQNVPGIKSAVFLKIRDLITVGS